MENVINLHPTHGATIQQMDEIFTKRQPGAVSLQHASDELESAIEAMIQYMYKDVLKSYEEAKAEVNCDEQILSYHIFNEVDFVAKSLFPNIKFI